MSLSRTSCFVFIALLATTLLLNCVRGQDASEAADLVLLRLLESAPTPATTTTNETTPAVVPATFAVTDNGDGTITAEVQNLLWAKCSQVNATGANMYNSSANDCSGAAASTFPFCSAADDSCNGGNSLGRLDGGGTSDVWNTCANLNLGGRTNWRVPSREELTAFFFGVYRSNTSLFDTPGPGNYWTGNSATSTQAFQLQITAGLLSATSSKTAVFGVRCVHTLP